MSDRLADVVELGDRAQASDVLATLFAASGPDHVLIRRPHITVGTGELATMVVACGSPMAATASPVPASSATTHAVRPVALHDRLPPPASIPLPCLDSMIVSREALRSVAPPVIDVRTPVDQMLLSLCAHLTDAGWRHVTAPSVALDWNPVALDASAEGRSRDVLRELAGPANEGLSTQRLWADYDLRSPRVVVDGACLTDAFHNGSQKVVINIARALKRSRPSAAVALAVREEFLDFITGELADHGLDVIARKGVDRAFDLVYRPYQLIDPAELSWLVDAGERFLLGQLDMIAFSNPSYHPTPALFHAVRNLQRRTLRLADGVTFISEFGEATTVAECPDLDRRRLFVVSCGTESEPVPAAPEHDARPVHTADDYVLCLSATFWHKNRQHALRVFDRLCDHHGYGGSLVIAGPQPFYGRSTDAERRLLDAMPADVAERVVDLGQVDEVTKWALLRQARLVLYPSILEGFGLVPFEAATVGTPSLSHAGSGLVDTLEGTASLVPTWSVDEWADRAYEIMTSIDLSGALVAGVERAAAQHTWDRVAVDTWAAIDATVATPSVRPRLEEGGWASRVAPPDQPLAIGTRALHFAHRCVAYLGRRLRHTS